MKTAPLPVLRAKFVFEVECEYNPFSGKDQEDFAISLQDEMHDLLDGIRPEVIGFYSDIEGLELIEKNAE